MIMLKPSHSRHYKESTQWSRINHKASMNSTDGMPRSRFKRICRRLFWVLHLCLQYNRLIKQIIIISLLTATALTIAYLFMFTPIAVYMLDRLNLRPFFLPNILCNNCTYLPFKYIINNQMVCEGQQVIPLFIIVI